MIEAKPYKLISYIQNYAWGTKGGSAFIPNFIGIEAEDIPYAELWIGAHPKLTSDIIIENKKFPLNLIIEKEKEKILGKKVIEKFGNRLPFLLKILSAGKALSIQTHPNKSEAIKFHNEDSKNYPDDNHKPEIAIAIDYLKALVGFRPADEIKYNLNLFPEIKEFIGLEEIDKKIYNKSGLQDVFTALIGKAEEKSLLTETIDKIRGEIEQNPDNSENQKVFKALFEQYGYDIGLLVFFFLNVVNLLPDEAIFTPSGIPHAYLEGNIVECMANSDNVIRAGLTPKFKDVERLSKILNYKTGSPEILGKDNSGEIIKYDVPVKEFLLKKYFIKEKTFTFETNQKLEIILIMKGEVKILNKVFKKGESFLIPAKLDKYNISASNAVLIRVTIPV